MPRHRVHIMTSPYPQRQGSGTTSTERDVEREAWPTDRVERPQEAADFRDVTAVKLESRFSTASLRWHFGHGGGAASCSATCITTEKDFSQRRQKNS
jgi:hypothetical protein